MQKKLVVSILSMTLPLIASHDKHLSVWGDYLSFKRTEGINKNLVYDTKSGGRCNVHSLLGSFDFEPGYRVGLGYLTPNWTAELTYFWLGKDHATCHRKAPGDIYFSLKHTDFGNDYEEADFGAARYGTGLQNAEANYYGYVTPRKKDYFAVAWLAGVRYIYLTEALDLMFQKGQNKSHYTIDAHNFMYGAQTGGVFQWNPWEWLSWDLVAKVGVAADYARQHTHLRDFNDSVTLRDYTKSKWGVPFIGEAIVKLTVSPLRWWDIYAGYEMLYLTGIACAPDQLVKHRTDEHIVRTKG